MKLLNGRTLGEAFEILAKPMRKKKSQKGAGTYWAIEQYGQRMNEAFGNGGYGVKYHMLPSIVMANTRQVVLFAECTIEIYGETGEVVHVSMGIGEESPSRLSLKYKGEDKDGREEWYERSDEERYYQFDNTAYFLQQTAFKNACKSMNIFNSLIKGEDEERQEQYYSSPAEKPQSQSYKNNEVFEFYVTDGGFEEVRKDRSTGKPVFNLLAHKVEEGGKRCREDADILIFYPNRYEKFQLKFDTCRAAERPYRIKIKATVGNGGGYVVTDILS